MAWAPVAIAISALVISIWSVLENRSHSRATVRPVLSVWSSIAANASEIGFGVQNSGAGPAIIRKIEVLLDGQVRDIRQIARMFDPVLESSDYRFYYLGEGFALGVGVRKSLFETLPSKMRDQDGFRNLLRRISVRASFCSVSDECFEWERKARAN
jgi:hypothetical protein